MSGFDSDKFKNYYAGMTSILYFGIKGRNVPISEELVA